MVETSTRPSGAISRVLVTGASGFVGRRLCDRLAGQGVSVAALSRQGAHIAGRIEWLSVGDLAEPVDWDRYVEGVDAVIHLAARVHLVRDAATDPLGVYRRVNTEATRALAIAAARQRVAQFIHVSTVKVLGENSGVRPFRAGDPANPQDPYAISKWEAEEALRELQATSGLAVTILRPPLVYGPGVRANFLSLMRLCDTPWPLPLGGIDNRRSLLYVDNLVDALIWALSGRAAGGTWLIADGEDVSTSELVRRLRQELGRPVRLMRAPLSLLRGAARQGRLRDVAERLTSSLAVTAAPLGGENGWQPPIPLAQGLAATVAWYRTERSR